MNTYINNDPNRQPPEWAQQYFDDCRELLGIGEDWHLFFSVADSPGDYTEADGHCLLNTRYWKAEIQMRRGLLEERGREVIMHELLHVALAPLDLAADRIRELLKEKHQEHADELYCDAQEQVIERLTRALQRSAKPPKMTESEGHSVITAI